MDSAYKSFKSSSSSSSEIFVLKALLPVMKYEPPLPHLEFKLASAKVLTLATVHIIAIQFSAAAKH